MYWYQQRLNDVYDVMVHALPEVEAVGSGGNVSGFPAAIPTYPMKCVPEFGWECVLGYPGVFVATVVSVVEVVVL